MKMFAYVTLVMLGDEFAEGAKVLAKSLLATQTPYDLVCMVTPDVSEVAVADLKKYYIVVTVDYIKYECPPMITKRQNEIYGHWIDYAFTKWQCLTLHHYKKIVYIDADHLVVKNIDHLFRLRAPALCFMDESFGYYDNLIYGDVVSSKTIDNYLRFNKVLCKGGTVLFEPNQKLYTTLTNLLNSNNRCLNKCYYHNGFDEQILLQAFVKLNIRVTCISLLYVWNAGSYHRLLKGQDPFVINYYGDVKPWHLIHTNHNINYMDIYIWKYFYQLNLNL